MSTPEDQDVIARASVAGNVVAQMVIEELTDMELLAIAMRVMLGQDLRGVAGFDTAKPMFTKHADGSLSVHDIVEDEILRAVADLQAGTRRRAV
ncbi:hypothetical protein [Glutamicibacter sp. V16R2B1]|uniref:hypothetical protein n=1 Tax=Glutamicibacter sp. V16R2B1 TaxID=2036207 RepID=UPI0010FE44D5|nr:hypothetical protein [Glutamicibacter sp. V16R2B1]MCK9901338.1 hypothetical protein [Frankia sp. Cpl3]TLK47810.1 hypothetical protein FDN03_15620 [Glutamicibacter sp. V16R2B1]